MERLRRIAVTRLEIYILTLHFQHDEMTHCCRSLPATPTPRTDTPQQAELVRKLHGYWLLRLKCF